jgi:phage terminase small subunit
MKSRERDEQGLNPQQASFAREYLVDLNATKAAIRAGYSPKTADRQGSRLLRNAVIAKAVQEGKLSRQERIEVNSDDVLRELVRISKADLRKVFNEDGNIKNPKDWPDEVAAFISSIEVEEIGERGVVIGHVKKIKLWPKVPALELLGKHLALWVERHELTGKDGAPLLGTMTDAELLAKTPEAVAVLKKAPTE